jgi:hypothetical protein
MKRQAFDAIWLPRLGPKAADGLWRARNWGRKAIPAAPLFACGAGGLAGHGVVGDVGAVICGLVAAVLVTQFLLWQRRLKGLMSEWFGVEVSGSPLMNQRSFDRWCAYHGYRHPDE